MSKLWIGNGSVSRVEFSTLGGAQTLQSIVVVPPIVMSGRIGGIFSPSSIAIAVIAVLDSRQVCSRRNVSPPQILNPAKSIHPGVNITGIGVVTSRQTDQSVSQLGRKSGEGRKRGRRKRGQDSFLGRPGPTPGPKQQAQAVPPGAVRAAVGDREVAVAPAAAADRGRQPAGVSQVRFTA